MSGDHKIQMSSLVGAMAMIASLSAPMLPDGPRRKRGKRTVGNRNVQKWGRTFKARKAK